MKKVLENIIPVSWLKECFDEYYEIFEVRSKLEYDYGRNVMIWLSDSGIIAFGDLIRDRVNAILPEGYSYGGYPGQDWIEWDEITPEVEVNPEEVLEKLEVPAKILRKLGFWYYKLEPIDGDESFAGWWAPKDLDGEFNEIVLPLTQITVPMEEREGIIPVSWLKECFEEYYEIYEVRSNLEYEYGRDVEIWLSDQGIIAFGDLIRDRVNAILPEGYSYGGHPGRDWIEWDEITPEVEVDSEQVLEKLEVPGGIIRKLDFWYYKPESIDGDGGFWMNRAERGDCEQRTVFSSEESAIEDASLRTQTPVPMELDETLMKYRIPEELYEFCRIEEEYSGFTGWWKDSKCIIEGYLDEILEELVPKHFGYSLFRSEWLDRFEEWAIENEKELPEGWREVEFLSLFEAYECEGTSEQRERFELKKKCFEELFPEKNLDMFLKRSKQKLYDFSTFRCEEYYNDLFFWSERTFEVPEEEAAIFKAWEEAVRLAEEADK